jgi:glutamate synthase (NADPH/NADH) large chain
MVDLEPIAPADPAASDDPAAPRPRSLGIEDTGMGDLLRFDAERLRILIERHLRLTGSARARALLEDWNDSVSRFVKIMPRDYRRALHDLQREPQAAAAE